MNNKIECELIYITKGHNDKGSPIVSETALKVIADDVGTWSSNYYVDRERSMMKSANLSVAKHLLKDTLMYVDFKGKRYSIKNYLTDNKRGDRYMILDIEEYKR